MTRTEMLIGLSVALGLNLLGTTGRAQQSPDIVSGVVRDSAGAPLQGVEVLLGTHRAVTSPAGQFQLLGIKDGTYPLIVRSPGFIPIRTSLAITDSRNRNLSFVLSHAPQRLPTVITEAHRPGIRGIVHDREYRPIPGARVLVEGVNGGTVFTDSSGHFALPKPDRGYYLLLVTHPDFSARRIFLELEPDNGKEIDVTLSIGSGISARQEEVALFDFKRRLLRARTRYWMPESELHHYGTMLLCNVPRVRAALGGSADGPLTVVLNGITGLRGVSLCYWSADEVELVELPPPSRRAPRSISPSPARAKEDTVVVWVKP